MLGLCTGQSPAASHEISVARHVANCHPALWGLSGSPQIQPGSMHGLKSSRTTAHCSGHQARQPPATHATWGPHLPWSSASTEDQQSSCTSQGVPETCASRWLQPSNASICRKTPRLRDMSMAPDSQRAAARLLRLFVRRHWRPTKNHWVGIRIKHRIPHVFRSGDSRDSGNHKLL